MAGGKVAKESECGLLRLEKRLGKDGCSLLAPNPEFLGKTWQGWATTEFLPGNRRNGSQSIPASGFLHAQDHLYWQIVTLIPSSSWNYALGVALLYAISF